MARRSSKYSQGDMTRMIKAAQAAGIGIDQITGIKMTDDGVEVLFGTRKQVQSEPENEWDEVLKS